MKSNFLASFSGSFFSLISMVLGAIDVSTMLEVLIYGILGGAAGLIGKSGIQWLGKIINKCKAKLNKQSKQLDSNQGTTKTST